MRCEAQRQHTSIIGLVTVGIGLPWPFLMRRSTSLSFQSLARRAAGPYAPDMRPILKQQEIPYDDSKSRWMFDPEADIAVAITPAAKEIYNDLAYELLAILTSMAKRYQGLDALQIFMSQDPSVEDLWVQEAEDAIVFHLPNEH